MVSKRDGWLSGWVCAHKLMTRPVALLQATPVQVQGDTMALFQPRNCRPAADKFQLLTEALKSIRITAANHALLSADSQQSSHVMRTTGSDSALAERSVVIGLRVV